MQAALGRGDGCGMVAAVPPGAEGGSCRTASRTAFVPVTCNGCSEDFLGRLCLAQGGSWSRA